MAENVVREVGKMYDAPEDNEARLEWAKDFDPQKRIAVPEDAAAVVAYLASDDAGAMTG
jgi:NAD(P)-dependent dehydrogenase (short-subunit alcohol dehydrogenase family)